MVLQYCGSWLCGSAANSNLYLSMFLPFSFYYIVYKYISTLSIDYFSLCLIPEASSGGNYK